MSSLLRLMLADKDSNLIFLVLSNFAKYVSFSALNGYVLLRFVCIEKGK